MSPYMVRTVGSWGVSIQQDATKIKKSELTCDMFHETPGQN